MAAGFEGNDGGRPAGAQRSAVTNAAPTASCEACKLGAQQLNLLHWKLRTKVGK